MDAQIRDPTHHSSFKTCRNCGHTWETIQTFLADPDISIVGYQVHFKELSTGVFLFNHTCNGTLAIQADVFKHLYEGPIFTTRATGSNECPGYCLHHIELRPCPVQCECAYIREIIQIILNWPKQTSSMPA